MVFLKIVISGDQILCLMCRPGLSSTLSGLPHSLPIDPLSVPSRLSRVWSGPQIQGVEWSPDPGCGVVSRSRVWSGLQIEGVEWSPDPGCGVVSRSRVWSGLQIQGVEWSPDRGCGVVYRSRVWSCLQIEGVEWSPDRGNGLSWTNTESLLVVL
ncbi:hypothetical protein RRG08_013701 [Elysia crispata]|uniref:Uncharacterized protein n=1 Tax=Elysia crispata TaxID=231223 RepID=A0AAE1DJJ9_9GAST|nr:hypothetical protein RRG08_013701 [Elysia crispata]